MDGQNGKRRYIKMSSDKFSKRVKKLKDKKKKNFSQDDRDKIRHVAYMTILSNEEVIIKAIRFMRQKGLFDIFQANMRTSPNNLQFYYYLVLAKMK